MANHNQKLHLGKFEPSQRANTIAYAFMAIGVLTFVAGLILNRERLWTSYLTNFFFFACLGIGGLFFVAINHAAKAGWSVTVRRISESMTSFLPVVLIGTLVLVAGAKYLYPWTDAARVAEDPLLQGKTPYLNYPFWIIRILVFGLGMLLFKKLMVGNSLKQDQSGDNQLTIDNVKWAVIFLLFFAVTYSLFSVDLLMTLLPHWFSTIFGIYCFAGLFQSTMAFMILLTLNVLYKGIVQGYITEEHVHDLAKYLKGFTVFWAYIAFSQFMLIWYANIPEETEFYVLRAMGGWMPISIGLLIFKFAVPFIALLPRWAKRTQGHLKAVCCLILFAQWMDIYWLVYPNFNDNAVTFSLWEVGMFLGFLGLFLAGIYRFLSKNNVIPVKDPRLHEALAHHVTY
ncbi:MAG: molybdopterin oxidoreductase [Pseudobdellovibrionaceae bacterium]